EARGQPRLDARPIPAAIVAAIHAAMVLLIEAVGQARRHHQAMHALAELRVFVVGHEVRARAAIARFPSGAAIAGVKDARRRNADPELLPVAWVRHQRMQDEAAAARDPFRPRGMVAQAADMVPVLSAIIAAKEPGRLDTGIERAI